MDRLRLVLALAYGLRCGIGLAARRRDRPGQRCSSNDPQHCSVFTVGRIMLTEMQVKASTAVAAVVAAIEKATKKWG